MSKSFALRGFTLVEILVATVLGLIVLAALIRVFLFARDLQREASSSYLIRQDAEIAFHKLQDDLRSTNLSTIRVQASDRGFSCASPLKGGDLRSFELTPYGVAKWKSWVHYTVVPKDEFIGHLVRWESPYPEDQYDPRPSPHRPSDVGASKQSLLPDVILPDVGLIEGPPPEALQELGPVKNSEGGGGLRLRFLRRAAGDELSQTNPAQVSDHEDIHWSSATTELVDCQLRVANRSKESGRWTIYELSFRVHPRN